MINIYLDAKLYNLPIYMYHGFDIIYKNREKKKMILVVEKYE